MAINGSDGCRGDVVVMMAVMTLVMQNDQEHWPERWFRFWSVR